MEEVIHLMLGLARWSSAFRLLAKFEGLRYLALARCQPSLYRPWGCGTRLRSCGLSEIQNLELLGSSIQMATSAPGEDRKFDGLVYLSPSGSGLPRNLNSTGCKADHCPDICWGLIFLVSDLRSQGSCSRCVSLSASSSPCSLKKWFEDCSWLSQRWNDSLARILSGSRSASYSR